MKKAVAVLALALPSLVAAADVVVPPETTGATAVEKATQWPMVFLMVAGVGLVIAIAARRRKAATPAK
ncbi:MAG TPA: hypothetical protein VF432_02050 [Thermoanaerobaculia bacterium]